MKTHCYCIYRVKGVVMGYEIPFKPTNKLRKEYDYLFDLCGREHHFFLVTSDDDIGREDAIAFAAGVAAGTMVRSNIDLSSVQGVRRNAK